MAIEKNISTSSFKVITVVSLILLILVVVGLTMFVLPLRSEFKESNQQLIQKQTELNTLKNQLTQLQAVETSFKGGEVTRKDILNLIPDGIYEDEVIEMLSDISDNNEVTLNSLSFGTGTGVEADVQTLIITTNISGSHSNIIDFLSDLEESSRKFVVNSIAIQILENRLENVSLNLEAYFL